MPTITRRHAPVRQRAARQPRLLVASPDGDFRPAALPALGRSGRDVCRVTRWIPLPRGTQLLTMPDCRPVGGRLEAPTILAEGLPVAAALPHGYTRTYLPAYEKIPGAPPLPLFGYTAVAAIDGELVVAAARTDDAPEWLPERFATPDLPERIADLQRALPFNAVVAQLSRC